MALSKSACPRFRFEGGHGKGRNTPGKSEFPWEDEEVIEVIEDILKNPDSIRPARDGREKWRKKHKGIQVEIIVGTKEEGRRTWTGYPNDKKIKKNPPSESRYDNDGYYGR